MGEIYRIDIDGDNIPNALIPIGALHIKNKCCENENVIVTKTKGVEVYSCQCACGGWCTTGCRNIQDAISAWERMCK